MVQIWDVPFSKTKGHPFGCPFDLMDTAIDETCTAQICCMIIPSGNDHHSVAAVETGGKQMSTGHLH